MIKTLLHGKLQPHKFHSEFFSRQPIFKEMENNWHEKFLPKLLNRWGLNPGRPGASLTRYLKTISLIANLRSILHLNMLRLILIIHSKDLRFYCQAASLVL